MALEPSQGRVVPRISEFFGITIAMYYNDHAPPHFHAKYGEHEATVLELRNNWEAARHGEPLERIAGLE